MRPARLLAAWLPLGAAARNVVTDPFPGVRVTDRVADGQRIYIAAVDLCRAGVSVRGTRPGERGATVPARAERAGVDVAINGNFFTPGRHSIEGTSAKRLSVMSVPAWQAGFVGSGFDQPPLMSRAW